MKLDRRLEAWKQAELIDAETAARILAHESSSSRPTLLWALGGLGALAIALGVASIVAANWAHISDFAKLGLGLAVGVALAGLLYRLLEFERPGEGVAPRGARMAETQWLPEALVIVYYGYALAALALVAQIYQLGGTAGSLLLYWTMGTAGLVFLGRGRVLGVIFFMGLLFTYRTLVIEWLTKFEMTHPAEEEYVKNVVVFLVGVYPLLTLICSRLLAHIPTLQCRRSHFASVFGAGSWALLALLGNAVQFLWYIDMTGGDAPIWGFSVCLAAGGIVVGFIPKFYREQSPRAQLGMRGTTLAVYGMGVLGGGIAHPELPLLGALLNLAFLGLLAWTALHVGWKGGFNLLTALVGMRVIGIYFEVFGSLLQTGLGLIGGGMLTLLIAWIWLRKSNVLADQLTDGSES